MISNDEEIWKMRHFDPNSDPKHFSNCHREETIKLQNEIKNFSQHFTLDENGKTIHCSHCNENLSIFLGRRDLSDHLLVIPNISLPSETATDEENKTDVAIQVTTEDENAGTSSQQDVTLLQALERSPNGPDPLCEYSFETSEYSFEIPFEQY